MAVADAHVFPGFLTLVLTQLFFAEPPTTLLTCFSRGERRKYAGKKVLLNRESNLQPPGHEDDTFTTEPPGRGTKSVQKVQLVLSRYALYMKATSQILTKSLGAYICISVLIDLH